MIRFDDLVRYLGSSVVSPEVGLDVGEKRNGYISGFSLLEGSTNIQEGIHRRKIKSHAFFQVRREGNTVEEKSNGSPGFDTHLFTWDGWNPAGTI